MQTTVYVTVEKAMILENGAWEIPVHNCKF